MLKQYTSPADLMSDQVKEIYPSENLVTNFLTHSHYIDIWSQAGHVELSF